MTEMASTQKRIEELDFIKCILILLMISFHLVYINETHPYAKQVVYTFHMPGFLIISGYLMNVGKQSAVFIKSMLAIAIPYIIMESGYIFMASIFPINEHIDELTLGVFADKLFLHPIGPYWYLKTLFICSAIYYIINKFDKINTINSLVLCGLLFYALSTTKSMSFSNSLYFLAGAAIRKSGKSFLDIFKPSWLSIIAFALLISSKGNLSRATSGGILIVYLSISIILFLYSIMPEKIRTKALRLGQNTLPIFLFSPIFTILCKVFLPYLMFDPSGMVYLAVSVPFCVAGSLIVSKALHLLAGFAAKKFKTLSAFGNK